MRCRHAAVLLTVLALVSCSKTSPTAPTTTSPAGLVGTWTSGVFQGNSVFATILSGNTLTLNDAEMPYDYTGNGFSPDDVSRAGFTSARQ
jgi:hypothetical protein